MKWFLVSLAAVLLLKISEAHECTKQAASKCFAVHGMPELGEAIMDVSKYFRDRTFNPPIAKICWHGLSLSKCLRAAADHCGDGDQWESSYARFVSLVLKQACFTDKIHWATWKESGRQTCWGDINRAHNVFYQREKCNEVFGFKDLVKIQHQDRDVCRKINRLIHCNLAADLECGHAPYGGYAQEMTRIRWRALMETVLKPYTRHPYYCYITFEDMPFETKADDVPKPTWWNLRLPKSNCTKAKREPRQPFFQKHIEHNRPVLRWGLW